MAVSTFSVTCVPSCLARVVTRYVLPRVKRTDVMGFHAVRKATPSLGMLNRAALCRGARSWGFWQ